MKMVRGVAKLVRRSPKAPRSPRHTASVVNRHYCVARQRNEDAVVFNWDPESFRAVLLVFWPILVSESRRTSVKSPVGFGDINEGREAFDVGLFMLCTSCLVTDMVGD